MKNKKIIIPLIAVAVLLALFACVMLIDDKPPATDTTSDAAPSDADFAGYIFDFDTSTISLITVYTTGEEFTFEKNGDLWYVKDNPSISISSASVNSLTGSIGSILYSEEISDGSVTPEDCGINDSSDFITFTSELGEVTLKRGIDTTDGLYTYVTHSLSDSIYIADLTSVNNIFKPLYSYRNKAYVNLDFENIKTISLKSDVTLSLEKVRADTANAIYSEWQITSPLKLGARDEQVNTLIIEPLQTINIDGFASDMGDYNNYGISLDDNYITLTDKSGKSATVYFSKSKSGKYYICINKDNTIYEISPASAPYADLKISDIFDRNIHLVKMDKISAVTINGNGYNYTVEFMADGGKVNGTKVSSGDMNNVIFPSVCGLFADDIALVPKGDEAVTITYKYKDGKSDTLVFLDTDERYYTVSKNGTVKYIILKHKISDLTNTLDGFKE